MTKLSNDCQEYDKRGQAKVINILNKLSNNKINYVQHIDDMSRTDIEFTATTKSYVIECKDRAEPYNIEFLKKNGAMIEIDKFNALKNHSNDKKIYANTSGDRCLFYDLTDVEIGDLEKSYLKRVKYTVDSSLGFKTVPCLIIPEKFISYVY